MSVREEYLPHQFIDLTEVQGISNLRTDSILTAFKVLPTEFAFAVSTPYTCRDDITRLTTLGFKAVSTMNNWFPTHSGEVRALTFYWAKLREKQEKIALQPARKKWAYLHDVEYAFHCEDMAASGCGFKIADNPRLSKKRFHKFFSLLRMPLLVSPLQERWLKRHHFRKIDTGSLATYWVNGWEPDTYDYKKIEAPYWEQFAKEASPIEKETE